MESNSPNNTHLFICAGDYGTDCYMYSILDNIWTSISSRSTSVYRPYCAFSSNYFYVFGGLRNKGWKLDTRDVLNNDWIELPNVDLSYYDAPAYGSAVVINDRYIFALGNADTNKPQNFRINIDPDGRNETVINETEWASGIERVYHNSAVYVPRLKQIFSIGGKATTRKIFITNVSIPTSEPTSYPTSQPTGKLMFIFFSIYCYVCCP